MKKAAYIHTYIYTYSSKRTTTITTTHWQNEVKKTTHTSDETRHKLTFTQLTQA